MRTDAFALSAVLAALLEAKASSQPSRWVPPMLVPPTVYGPQGFVFYLQNNSDLTLSCHGRLPLPQMAWTPYQSRPPGGEWEFGGFLNSYLVQCQAPVEQVAYNLVAGRVYGLQRDPRDPRIIRLIEVKAD